MPVISFFGTCSFGPSDIRAISKAFDDVCEVLDLRIDDPLRAVIAKRIAALAREGEHCPMRLRDTVLTIFEVHDDRLISFGE